MADEGAVPQRQVTMVQVYLKELKFSSTANPHVASTGKAIAQLVNIRSTNAAVDDDLIEVTIDLGLRANIDSETVMRASIVQAGIFRITGYDPEQMLEILGRVCPEILYPFALRTLHATFRRGDYLSIGLTPIDFQALFERNLDRIAERQSATE